MDDYILCVLLCSSILLVQGIGAVARKSCSSEFQSDLSIKVECRYGIEECSQRRLEGMFPGLYNQSSWGHDAPAELRTSPVCRNSVPGIQLTWKPPQHHGAASIMGFGIHGGHMTDYRCFIVRLVEDVTQSKMASTFSGIIYPVQRDVPYNVVVYSLPRSATSKNVTDTLFTKNCGENMTSSTWSPRDFNISYNRDTRALSVAFESPPEQYNFERFQLTLLSSRNITTLTIDQPRHTFYDINPGKYDLRMQPYDPDPFNHQRCLCRNSQKVCASCIQFQEIFVARDVTSTPATEEIKSTNQQHPYPQVDVVSFVIAVLIVGVIVIGFVLLLFCRSFRSKGKESRKIGYKEPEVSHPPTLFLIRDSRTCSDPDKIKLERLAWLLSEELPCHVVHRVVEGYDNIEDVLHKFYGSRDSVHEGAKLYNKDSECKHVCVCCLATLNKDSRTCLNDLLEVQQTLTNVNFVNVFITADYINKNEFVSKKDSSIRTFDLVRDNGALIGFIKDTLTLKDNVQDLGSQKYQSEEKLNAMVDNRKTNSSVSSERMTACQLSDAPEARKCAEVPLVRRERYISRDSGHGASDSSYKSSSTEECHSLVINNEHPCANSSCTMVAQGTIRYGNPPGRYMAGNRDHEDDNEGIFYEFGGLTNCPPGLFIPPDPSETSDCDSRDFQIAPNCRSQNAQTYDVYEKCVNTCHMDDDVFISGRRTMKMKASSKGTSMETLMDKLVAINERSDLLHRIGRPGDTFTVCEDFV